MLPKPAKFNLSVSSAYKPPTQTFNLPHEVSGDHINVAIEDFNSHHVTWEYRETNGDGKLVENWADASHMVLIHDAKLPSSFLSERWRRGYNPDRVSTLPTHVRNQFRTPSIN